MGPAEAADLRERKRIADDTTLWMLLVVSVAVVVPWFVRLLPIDLSVIARATFGFTLLYVALATLTDGLRGPRSLGLATWFLQASGVVFLGLLWHLVGGLQVPMLLLVFVLPVMASGLVLGRWQPYGAALLSVVVVGVIALSESRELRWYLPQIGFRVDRIVGSLALRLDRSAPFPSLASPPDQLLVLLEIFVVLQLACALLSNRLARTLHQVSRRLVVFTEAQRGVSGLFQAALKAAATPIVLVSSENGRIVLASEGFLKRMLRHGENLSGVDLFDVMRFAQPGRIRELLQAGGELSFCRYRIGSESCVATLRVDAFPYEDARYACVRLDDATEALYVSTALKTTEEPLLVIGSDDRLRYANRAAEDLFGELCFGMEASSALAGSELAKRWWSIDDTPNGGRRLQIRDATYLVTAADAKTSDAGEALTVVTLRPRRPKSPVGKPSY